MEEYKLFINGKWIKSYSKKTFNSINPATEKIIGKFQSGNEKDVNNAVQAAQNAFKQWKEIPAPKKSELLFEIVKILRKRKKELSKLITQEMGKPLSESLGEVQEAIEIFEYMAGEGRRLFGKTTVSELKDKFNMTIRLPYGIIGVITPWNFPIAIPALKIAPALICGNTIVFKPSSDTPLIATKLIEVLIQAGIPKGVINLVTGTGKEVGTSIIKHNKIQGISFTGSKETGKFISKNAGLKKLGLELGGKNAVIVMNDADLDLAVKGIIWSAFATSGQRCTAASRVIVHKKIKKELEKKLVEKTKKLRLVNGLNSSVNVGPLVNEKALNKVENYFLIGKKEKAKILCGGYRLEKKGFFFKPTIFTNVKSNMRIAQEEIFGPVLSLIQVNNLNEAIKVSNSIAFGLSSSIYTNDLRNAFKAIKEIEAGITYVNSGTIGAESHLPFGGIKATGFTREGGWTAIEEFSYIKTIYLDYSNELQKAQGIKWNE